MKMFYSGGGILNKVFMGALAVIALCIALEMAKDTVMNVLVPLVPWLLGVAAVIALVVILRIVHRYLSR